jgi:hypothetical protein
MSAPFSYQPVVDMAGLRKESIDVWRILRATWLLTGLLVAPALWAQVADQAPAAAPSTTEPQATTEPQPPAEAVGVVVSLTGGSVTTLDMSYPDPVTMTEISADLQKITQWTGWAVGTPQFESVGKTNSVHVPVTEAPPVQGVLDDVVWPLVAALADRGRLGIMIQGGQIATANLRLENRFVTLEQSGGQGVQLFQAFIKDAGFGTIEELKRPELTDGRRAGGGSKFGLAWLLVIIASIATGIAVYLFTSRKVKR